MEDIEWRWVALALGASWRCGGLHETAVLIFPLQLLPCVRIGRPVAIPIAIPIAIPTAIPFSTELTHPATTLYRRSDGDWQAAGSEAAPTYSLGFDLVSKQPMAPAGACAAPAKAGTALCRSLFTEPLKAAGMILIAPKR